jgi:hypothetical protein
MIQAVRFISTIILHHQLTAYIYMRWDLGLVIQILSNL